MALDPGDIAATHGLSKRIYDQWVSDLAIPAPADLPISFRAPYVAKQKASAYGVAKSVVDEINANLGSGSAVPLVIAPGQTFTVPDNTQVTFGTAILIQAGGSILVQGTGSLQWVD